MKVLVGQSQDQRPGLEINFMKKKIPRIKNKSLFLVGPKKREAYKALYPFNNLVEIKDEILES